MRCRTYRNVRHGSRKNSQNETFNEPCLCSRLRAATLIAAACLVSSLDCQAQISGPAYDLLNARVSANRSAFYVYKDADSGLNHGFASGCYGATWKIAVESACVDDPASPEGCSDDFSRIDTDRGTVLRIAFAPIEPDQWAGVNIEEPENWGAVRQGGATICVEPKR